MTGPRGGRYTCNMQQLRKSTVLRVSSDHCARELLAGVPSVMRFIRHQMRGHRQAELTVAQFRALVFLSHNDAAALSALAEHIGLSLPATSRMVELLVKRGLIERQVRSSDRRCVSLSLTGRGKAIFRTALEATQAVLARRLDDLSAGELSLVSQAMGILSQVFSTESCHMESDK